jgi:hypothetical protein
MYPCMYLYRFESQSGNMYTWRHHIRYQYTTPEHFYTATGVNGFCICGRDKDHLHTSSMLYTYTVVHTDTS